MTTVTNYVEHMYTLWFKFMFCVSCTSYMMRPN